jgi:hypothetical protein
MTTSRKLKWLTGLCEAVLGFPILGGIIVISLSWTPLFIMLVLHILTYFLSKQNHESTYGSILGILTSLVAWIPGVGFILHILSAIVLIISAASKR